jgi:hypothetical protein
MSIWYTTTKRRNTPVNPIAIETAEGAWFDSATNEGSGMLSHTQAHKVLRDHFLEIDDLVAELGPAPWDITKVFEWMGY